MKSIKMIFLVWLTTLACGCATTGELNHIKYHVENVEVRVKSDTSGTKTLQWQSEPGYLGNLNTQQACTYFMPSEPKFSMGSSWAKLKEIVEIQGRFVGLYPTLPEDKNSLIAEFKKRSNNSCSFLVYGEIDCWGNSLCSKPFTIHVVNSEGQSTEDFTLPVREGVPLRTWPKLALEGIIEIPVLIVTAVIVVIAAPLSLIHSSPQGNK